MSTSKIKKNIRNSSAPLVPVQQFLEDKQQQDVDEMYKLIELEHPRGKNKAGNS